MNFNWSSFTPMSALLGGLLIGLASVVLLIGIGKVAGISGMVGNLLSSAKQPSQRWRWAFLIGLLLSPWVYRVYQQIPTPDIQASWIQIVMAGLLVGFGTRLASGCTSGHGVCGLSRLSFRSLVATLVFIGSGVLTTYLVRHVF
jgi:uncharacterized membrane protein YedE/YeeE